MIEEKIFENKAEMERVILVGLSDEENLDELEELVRTAGACAVGRMTQERSQPDNATYLGSGKLQELSMMVEALDATGIVCDDELSPAQIGNMERVLQTKIMDRTLLILDIFAARASTSEGKIQVELAQLRYRMTRLRGFGTSLSRLGGGIGTRGPGEKKLETDKRLIKDRISGLKRELEEVKCHREVQRSQRKKNRIPVAAIVGYTNAGKSTLLHALTGAEVLQEDKLFATLDPTTRELKLPSGQEMLLTDTVGFINKLPHHLVDAFRSTLEEAKHADLIIHVADASNEKVELQMMTVYETLRELGISDKPIFTLFNKQDCIQGDISLRDVRAQKIIWISARTGAGLSDILETLEVYLRENRMLLERVFSYQDAGKISYVRQFGELIEERYTENGIYIKAYLPKEWYTKIALS